MTWKNQPDGDPTPVYREEAPVYVPIHIKGAGEIAAIFGVARETVIRWAKDGAPIRKIGKKYQARYDQLWNWILENVDS